MIRHDDTKPVTSTLCMVGLGLLVLSFFFWPNFWRYRVFGPEPGSEGLVGVERAELIDRCEGILAGMEKAERDQTKLEQEARDLERDVSQLRAHPDVDLERLERSDIPVLLASVKKSADRRVMVRFGAYREYLASVAARLNAGEYPAQYAGFVAQAEAALKEIEKENQRRLSDSESLHSILRE
jgi:hypothetical protein